MHIVMLLLTPVLWADVALPLPAPAALQQQLRSARSEVVVEGVTLVLRAELNRSFMPSSPPDGNPIIGEVCVASKDWRRTPRALPERLPFEAEIDQVWISRGDTVLWKPKRLEPLRRNMMLPSTRIEGGPKLEPGTMVDVVVRFAVHKRVYFVRAPDVRVSRSD
jgi:hypothetical protein